MFREYFGIEENPFSNTPDPNYLFMSERHQEALAHLQYGVHGTSGFVLLTGEVGTGKTTVCRCLVEQLPDHVDLALCLNPRMSEAELLATICDELKIDTAFCQPDSIKDHMDVLNRRLLEGHGNGRRAVLVVDEAQNLDYALLEQIRLLTNLETASTKLLQVILIGQPELRDRLAESDLRQLSQRVTARYHLEPMTRAESDSYIRHRLQVGGLNADLFDAEALAGIFDRSGGIPRLINSICERCLLGAYAEGKTRIDAALAQTAAVEVLGESGPAPATGAAPRPAAEPTPGSGARKGLPPVGLTTGLTLAAATVIVLLSTATLENNRTGEASSPTPGPSTDEKTPMVPDAQAPEAMVPASGGDGAQAEPPMEQGAPVTPVEVYPPPETAAADPAAAPAEPESPAASEPAVAVVIESQSPPAKAPAEAPADASAAGVPATPPAAEQITLDNLFHHPGITGGLESAAARLMAYWNRKPSAFGGINLCADAERQGLKCYRRRGTWEDLERINRPAVISLVDGNGSGRYAVVTGLEGSTVTLRVDGRKFAADAERLKPLWTGEFLVLWEPLPGIREILRPGMAGSDVAWLRGRLAEILGEPADLENARTFDDGLKRQVIAFQRSRRLKGDGIVGPLTQIHLAAAVGGAVPALRPQP